jgi:hypothetical protein
MRYYFSDRQSGVTPPHSKAHEVVFGVFGEQRSDLAAVV